MSTDAVRAALAELVACHTEEAGLTMSMVANRADFDAFMERCDQRLAAALDAARAALSAANSDSVGLAAASNGSPGGASTRDTLCWRLQQQCSDWGTYWRASDAHGVNLDLEQAHELLRTALGVEVEIAAPSPDTQLLGDALSALEYHQEQTRPIHSTQVAIDALRLALARQP